MNMGTEYDLERLVDAYKRSGHTYASLAAQLGNRPTTTTCYNILTGATARPRWDTLLRIATALGVPDVLRVSAPCDCTVVAQFELPIVAEASAPYGDVRPTADAGGGEEGRSVNLAGLVGVQVTGDSLLPLASEGQVVVANQALHPDEAEPPPHYADPLAVVRLRDGRHLIRRWHRMQGARTRVRLITVREGDLAADGLPVHEDVRDRDVLEAWTVVGVVWAG